MFEVNQYVQEEEVNLRKIIKGLPKGYELREMGFNEYRDCLRNEWSRKLCDCLQSYHELRQNGIGYVLYRDAELFCGTVLLQNEGIGTLLMAASTEEVDQLFQEIPLAAVILEAKLQKINIA